jgi:hypothetical protein
MDKKERITETNGVISVYGRVSKSVNLTHRDICPGGGDAALQVNHVLFTVLLEVYHLSRVQAM